MIITCHAFSPIVNLIRKQIVVKKAIACVLALVCLHAHAQRTTYNFNSNWKVFVGDTVAAKETAFPDASWRSVTLPWAWNEDEAFKKDIKDLSTGIAWYRKHFKLPASPSTQKIFLEFEGIRQAGDFYLNGKYLGMHENGVTAFGFDISGLVKVGDSENVLAVRIDNSWEYHERATNTKFQWEDKNFNANYGGINKNVYLHVTPEVYQTLPLFTTLGTTGVYIYADEFNVKERKATIHAESEVKNSADQPQTIQYEVSISDAWGKPVKTFAGELTTLAPGSTTIVKAASTISGLYFWSWGFGYLYTVQTIVKINGKPVDVVSTKTGFRKTEFKDGMIYLNDRVIMVHGYAQRTSNEWPAIGLSVPAWLSDYTLDAHYTLETGC
jgi:beta-galactosidase